VTLDPASIELGELGAWGAAAVVRIADDAPGASAGLASIDPGVVLAQLHPDERAAGAALPIARRGEWAAGRLALRAALTRAGADADLPIGVDDRGAPRVPAGFTGSISHKRGLAIALAAPLDAGARLGVDLELDAPSKVAIDARVLTAAEREGLASLDDDVRGRAVMLRFAIKEAVYKAVDPFVRRYVGFQEVELALDDAGAARVTSALGLAIDAGWMRWHDCVIAFARAR
jgi:4'-phosphopantetheinyl transferase EntD